MLGRFVALDLTGGHSRFAGSMLAHLGMRVVRPMRAGTDEMSDAGTWFENSGKTLLPVDTLERVERALADVDVILTDEETPALWRLSAGELAARNDTAIVSVITPFGMEGPRSGFAASELTLQAASGIMWLIGDADRPPVPLAGNQSAYHGAAQAVVGVLAALLSRERGQGSGELVDVSCHEALCNAIVMAKAWWYVAGNNLQRSSMNPIGGQVQTRLVWRARDGDIFWRISLGLGDSERGMRALVAWMVSETGLGEELREVSWSNISTLEVATEELRSWEALFAAFFETKTRAELFNGARARDLVLLPVLAPAELLGDAHLIARDAFQVVTTASGRFCLPAFPVRASAIDYRRRPPLALQAQPAWSSVPPADRTPPRRVLPLAGLKVLDFTWAVAGPVVTRHLGLLGATVVKVETNTRLDPTRASTPFAGRPSRDRSGYFSAHNNNKLSLTLDLNHPQSRQVVQRLVGWADAVCENFSAQRLEGWDLGYDVLRSWKEDVILLRSSTWGQTGPYATAPATGVVLGGFAGLGYLTGWADRPPRVPIEPYTDMISPWYAAAALIAALIDRRFTGRGTVIDVSQLECVLNFLGPEIAAASAGNPSERSGPLTVKPYPAGVFMSAGDEEWCVVSVRDRAEWQALCRIVPGFAGMENLPPEQIETAAAFTFATLAQYFLGRTAQTAVAELQAQGIPAAKVARPEDLFSDPQLAYRQHFVELEHPAMGKFAYEMPSFRYRNHAIAIGRSPLIGEHTGLVLGQFLGFNENEIADLYAEGVVN